MFFVIHNVDKPGQGEVRAGARPAHLEYIKNAADRLGSSAVPPSST